MECQNVLAILSDENKIDLAVCFFTNHFLFYQKIRGKVKLLAGIFVNSEKFEKVDYHAFWSRFALG